MDEREIDVEEFGPLLLHKSIAEAPRLYLIFSGLAYFYFSHPNINIPRSVTKYFSYCLLTYPASPLWSVDKLHQLTIDRIMELLGVYDSLQYMHTSIQKPLNLHRLNITARCKKEKFF